MPLDLAKIRARWFTFSTSWKIDDNGNMRDESGARLIFAHNYDSWAFGDANVEAAILSAPTDIAAMISELDRLTSELAAAQAAPVVEWRTRIDVEEATVGAFALLVESDGWRLEVSDGTGDYWIVDSGDETGDAGKAACEAAYRRACGFPPQAAPVAPQVVRLHQAYEGTTVCLHCGEPMPWPEMDRCPRDSGFPTAPPCAW